MVLLLTVVVDGVDPLVTVFSLPPTESILVCCSLDWLRDFVGAEGTGVT